MQEITQRTLQRDRDGLHVVDRDIAFRSFDGPDVRAMQAAQISERFLRQARCFSQPVHVGGEDLSSGWVTVLDVLHGDEEDGSVTTLYLQT